MTHVRVDAQRRGFLLDPRAYLALLRSAGSWRCAAVAVGLVLVAGTAGCVTGRTGVDADSLVGEYRSAGSAVLVLDADGTFEVTELPVAVLAEPGATGSVDAAGRWEHREDAGFVYLSVDEVSDPGTTTAGIQLYVADRDSVYFLTDVERREKVELDRHERPRR